MTRCWSSYRDGDDEVRAFWQRSHDGGPSGWAPLSPSLTPRDGNILAKVIRGSRMSSKEDSMDKKRSVFAPFVAAAGLAVLLGSAAVAAAQPQDVSIYRADRISTQGQITSISREGRDYRVGLNH